MTLVSEAFKLYLQRITPPPTQLEAARRSNNALRSWLRNDEYFGGLLETTFLNGSYARGTVIRPIKDVDIIVVVDSGWREAIPNDVMESLRRKLAQRYPGRRTRRLRRAINVSLSDINLDVLLAVAPSGLNAPLQIPDRNDDEWIETHPRLQQQLIRELGRKTNGNYTALVRLVKQWAAARVARDHLPGSFTLECLAYHCMVSDPDLFKGPLDDAFLALLEAIIGFDLGINGWGWRDDPTVRNPALPELNVADRWTAASAELFLEKAGLAARRGKAAGRARSDKTCLDKWDEVFGGGFPGRRAVRSS